ncbi:hypothetical protein [Prochlorococcus marinus]|uniref:hypothetical protein n=1 Tax=Prochlorococcus marinus TaxID=1219 RepID=UPI001ADAE451|nr:hypothetical protein [Prochlorococcus marinus]MBO8204970.1 hypothetical protein [Prochlorococcus marinus CUG1415]MBW3044243.1 hypothetical protein [Prochlorococcus marinus str. MU1415]
MSQDFKKTKFNKLKIVLIDSKESLLENISFLKKGYGWSNNRSQNLLNKLLINNKTIKFYGVKLTNKEGIILGSLLIFYQGLTKDNIKIINMSSIYVEPNSRGIGSIYMLKQTVELLSDFVITNVTSNLAVNKILTKFGFYKGEFKNYNFNIFNFILKFNIFKIISINKLSILQNNKDFYYLNNIRYQKGDSFEVSININYKVLNLIILKCTISKNFLKETVNFNMVKILYASNINLFKDYFNEIQLYLMFKTQSFFVTTHLEIPESYKRFKSSSEQLFFSQKNIGIDYLSLGSELTFYA